MRQLKFIALIILIVAASGCTNITDGDVEAGKKAFETGDPAYCEKLSDEMGRDICFSTLASKNRDETLCERVKDIKFKDGCYVSLSMIMQEPILCEKISDKTMIAECKDSVERLGKEIVLKAIE